jgi:hypothetical protein
VFSGGLAGVVATLLSVPPVFLWMIVWGVIVAVLGLLQLRWPTPPIKSESSTHQRAKIHEWRQGMDVLRYWQGREFQARLRNSETYSELLPYLSEDVRRAVEGDGDAAIPQHRRRGELLLYNAIMDEIAALEKRWGLL